MGRSLWPLIALHRRFQLGKSGPDIIQLTAIVTDVLEPAVNHRPSLNTDDSFSLNSCPVLAFASSPETCMLIITKDENFVTVRHNESHAQACTYTSSNCLIYMCKFAHVIRYAVPSQNFHFCCFKATAYTRLQN